MSGSHLLRAAAENVPSKLYFHYPPKSTDTDFLEGSKKRLRKTTVEHFSAFLQILLPCQDQSRNLTFDWADDMCATKMTCSNRRRVWSTRELWRMNIMKVRGKYEKLTGPFVWSQDLHSPCMRAIGFRDFQKLIVFRAYIFLRKCITFFTVYLVNATFRYFIIFEKYFV